MEGLTRRKEIFRMYLPVPYSVVGLKDKVYPISCVSDEGFEAIKQAMLVEVLKVREAEAQV